MKSLWILVVFTFILIGCKKDTLPIPAESTSQYYQSDGNFLLLVIGDTLEASYEYNLASTPGPHDSLLFSSELVDDGSGMYNYQHWKLDQNEDTLFTFYQNNFTFWEDEIPLNELSHFLPPLPFHANDFQVISASPSTDLTAIWNKISSYDIVKAYRILSPKSKIGISRNIMMVHDEALGFSVPSEKYFVYLVK